MSKESEESSPKGCAGAKRKVKNRMLNIAKQHFFFKMKMKLLCPLLFIFPTMTWLLKYFDCLQNCYILIETKFAFSITMKDKPVNEFIK